MNQEIVKKYFVGDGVDAVLILTEAKEERAKHFEKVNSLVAKYGADSAWGRNSVTSLAFKCDGKPEWKDGFLKPKMERSEGVSYAIYSPDKRCKAGKTIIVDFEQVGSFNFSDFIVKKLGMSCSVFGTENGRMVRSTTQAGNYFDTMVVVFPCGGDSRPSDISIPPFLREIKKSEFIAITEESGK